MLMLMLMLMKTNNGNSNIDADGTVVVDKYNINSIDKTDVQCM
jgi:hypothetical protein